MKPGLHELLALRGMALQGINRGQAKGASAIAGSGFHRVAAPVLAGRGLQFAESRPYRRGDDTRSIDWKVTARQGRPHTKVFESERERPRWIVVDGGPSMQFGSRVMFKSVLAALAAAWIAWVGRAGGDRVGGCLVDPAGSRVLRPTAGDRGVVALLQALCAPMAETTSTAPPYAGLTAALGPLHAQLKRGDRLFLLSDFYALDAPDDRLQGLLGQLAERAEITLLHVIDPLEVEAPPAARYPVLHAGRVVWADLADRNTREAWESAHFERSGKLQAIARRHGCQLITLATDGHLPAMLEALR